jgi:hypothetical protein
MKKFLSTVLLVIAVMCSLLFGISAFVLGFRIIQLLIKGAINPILCLEFLAVVALMGICLAATKAFGDKADVDVKLTSDTIVGKHPNVDYDASSWYPSTKMGLKLDLGALTKENFIMPNKRNDEDE